MIRCVFLLGELEISIGLENLILLLPLVLIPVSRLEEEEHLDIIFMTTDYSFS